MRRHRDGSWSEKIRFTLDRRDTVPALLARRARRHPKDVAVIRTDEVGASRKITADELQVEVQTLARGLVGRGIRPGEAVAILSSTSYEWMLLDLAILSVGAITVPIYESDSAEQIAHILSDASVVEVVTATTQQAELVQTVRTPSVRSVAALDKGFMRELQGAAKTIPPSAVEQRLSRLDLDDVATIIYTSGTTGRPKGVTLTHRNFVGTVESARQILPEIVENPETRLLLFLPLAHVLARYIMHLILSGRGVMAFSPDVKNLLRDIAAFKPSVLLAVPRVLEKVYNAAAAKAGGGLKGRMFSWSAKQARDWSAGSEHALGPSPALRLRHRIADRLVLGKIRDVLGPNMKFIVCGGAPLATDLFRFFVGTGLTVLQGYGLSETTGPISVQRPGANPAGTVGLVLPGNRLRISRDGEILVKGVSVMQGYWNLPSETAQAIEDGWFHTGDLGSISRKGQLTITGRKKELIVTAGGKNVSPEILEDSLATHPLIANVIVVGEARPYIGALITLDQEMLPTWLRNHGLAPVDAAHAADLPAVRESLDKAIARANSAVSRAESIRRFRIVDAVFTVENGYMTPSLKLRRSAVLKDYAHEVDALYAEGAREGDR
ncbi:long-chain fatty acid--CoA ligase [Schaalia sp. 19OD2882]|uniref:AMP-dependent synthetase/ligase n=1 Tax=Schaalia sp. 19OD2882 TaxID=2794089 RepID=UPI001C1F17A9|nr:AMP-dependent synthetase/ligase [Schaalia sp. 19OD2882]QWW20530.1 long-chain fatty acid--CoA ligase [Schaalia sp. 19OD2882]